MLLLLNYSLLVPLNNIDNIKYVLLIKRSKSSKTNQKYASKDQVTIIIIYSNFYILKIFDYPYLIIIKSNFLLKDNFTNLKTIFVGIDFYL